MKGVIDKLYKVTFTEMIMHSYYTSWLKFVTDVKRMFKQCTEKRLMTMPQELYKTTLENGIKRRMLITWGNFSCLEPIDAELVAEVIAVSAAGNYLYKTIVPKPDSDEESSEIESDGEKELNRKVGQLPRGEDEYIYKLRVKRADRNRRIYTKTQFKDVSIYSDLG